MDTLLHGKFGNILGQDLKKKGYSINVGYFIYGNMLPDLSPFYRFSMHVKEKDFNDVIKIMEELIASSEKLTLKHFSIKFGIVVHYLCDFFTFPHNRGFNKSIIQHEIYEQIQRIILWDKIDGIWGKYSEETEIKLRSFEEITNYIDDMYLIYNNNISNKERDIFFMIILTRVVCYSIMDLRRISTIKNKINDITVSCL